MVFFCQQPQAFVLYSLRNRQGVSSSTDDAAQKLHEVEGLAFNFGQRALQPVCAHSIQVQMGNQKALHTAAARGEALFTELT
jgi:hypothetical protein